MTVSEFITWLAYRMIQPFGDNLADVRNAMSMKLTADMNRKKGTRPHDMTIFFPKFKTTEKQAPGGMFHAFYAGYVSQGGDPKHLSGFAERYLEK